ncbi:Probable transposase [Borreliella japonica]|uniref:Probable transposase n=1 Tax=Borreliella japonica TaxID=34095 RepID=A0A1G4Q1D0_BORJA|nr:Probable transposase [Borreliella japonica]
MLSDKKDYYEKNKQSLSVNPSNYKNEFPFLKEVDSLALCSAWIDLNSAYSNFFREIKKENRTQGFPKYKSKKNRQTFRTNNQKNSIRIENDYIKLHKIGFVKLALHRNIKSNEVIKNVVVEKDIATLNNKFYSKFCCGFFSITDLKYCKFATGVHGPKAFLIFKLIHTIKFVI